MAPDEVLKNSAMNVKEQDLMRMVLQTSVAALVNVQIVEVVDGKMKRRAAMEN